MQPLTTPLKKICSIRTQFATAPITICTHTGAPATICIAKCVQMLHLIEYLDLGDMMNAFPSFCTIILMPFFYSIDHAIVAGLGACLWLSGGVGC